MRRASATVEGTAAITTCLHTYMDPVIQAVGARGLQCEEKYYQHPDRRLQGSLSRLVTYC